MGRKLMASAIMLTLAHSDMTLARCLAPTASDGRDCKGVYGSKGQRKANKQNRWR